MSAESHQVSSQSKHRRPPLCFLKFRGMPRHAAATLTVVIGNMFLAVGSVALTEVSIIGNAAVSS